MDDLHTELSTLLEEKKNWDVKMANLRTKMREECIHLIEQFNFTAEELGLGRTGMPGKGFRNRKPRKAAPPKFQSPYEAGVTWNGTGRAPKWFRKAKEEGYTDDILLIGKPVEKNAED